jgi:uncharacterized protein YeaO (DUF488 family)
MIYTSYLNNPKGKDQRFVRIAICNTHRGGVAIHDKDLAPCQSIREMARAGKLDQTEFSKLYKDQLKAHFKIKKNEKKIIEMYNSPVDFLLLCHEKPIKGNNVIYCHRLVLREFLLFNYNMHISELEYK